MRFNSVIEPFVVPEGATYAVTTPEKLTGAAALKVTASATDGALPSATTVTKSLTARLEPLPPIWVTVVVAVVEKVTVAPARSATVREPGADALAAV